MSQSDKKSAREKNLAPKKQELLEKAIEVGDFCNFKEFCECYDVKDVAADLLVKSMKSDDESLWLEMSDQQRFLFKHKGIQHMYRIDYEARDAVKKKSRQRAEQRKKAKLNQGKSDGT